MSGRILEARDAVALSLKDPEADRLAREVAARTGETLTTAVIVALRERLARLRGRSKRRRLLDEPEAEDFRAAVEDDATRLLSAATLLETAIVIEARKGEQVGANSIC